MDPNSLFANLENEVKRSFANVCWSHKIQIKEAECLKVQGLIMDITLITLSALISILGCVNIMVPHLGWSIISLILSAVLTGLTIFSKSFKFEERRQSHKQSADSLWLVREKYVSLIVDIHNQVSPIEELMHRREALLELTAELYAKAPQTGRDAYENAKKAIDAGEAVFEEGEIERLFGVPLQGSSPQAGV